MKVLLCVSRLFMLLGCIAVVLILALWKDMYFVEDKSAIAFILESSWLVAFINFLVIIFAGIPVNLWNMLKESNMKHFKASLVSAFYIVFVPIYVILFFYAFSLLD